MAIAVPTAPAVTTPPALCGYWVECFAGDHICHRPASAAYLDGATVYIVLCARHDTGGAGRAAQNRGLVRVVIVP